MLSDGFIKLHRSIRKNFLWKDKPFTKGQAWIDLLMDARFDDGGYFKRNIWIPLSRGQVGRSELTLADNWGWSRGKVRRFLETLKNESMVTLKQDNKTTVITICEYETYQGRENIDSTPNSTADSTPNGHQTDTKRYTKKKEKNGNKEKNEKKVLKPENVTDQTWDDFQTHRKALKAPITQTVINTFSNEAQKAGISLESAMIESISRSWRGFKAEWYLKDKQKNQEALFFEDDFSGFINQEPPPNMIELEKGKDYESE